MRADDLETIERGPRLWCGHVVTLRELYDVAERRGEQQRTRPPRGAVTSLVAEPTAGEALSSSRPS